MTTTDRFYQVVQKPHITEKGSDGTSSHNAYQFRVPLDANKVEIRQAVEKLFNVKVLKVNTLSVKPRVRRRGYVAGETQAWKKARVVLADGNTIEIL